MPIKQQTTMPTEADLESRIHSVLQHAFPWLQSADLKHQTKFQFKFGRKIIQIDGTTVSSAQARLDILISHNGIALAILELKRQGSRLTVDDEEQGLSYARMIHPQPPLVVVSNGNETRVLATRTGEIWKPESPSATELARLIEAAGKVSAEDMNHAVEVLLGPSSTVWVSAVRAAAQVSIEDQTCDWGEDFLPFMSDFLIPRQVTNDVLLKIQGQKRLVIVEGAPLVGKSNVLRDVVKRTAESDDFAVLFVEADSAGSGIFQELASILSEALSWSVSAENIRVWLRQLSHSEGPALVLAIDGICATRNEVRRDIEELTGSTFGSKLKILLAIDDTVTKKLVRNETDRKDTRIGRRASRVQVEALNDAEFSDAMDVLRNKRIAIMHGGDKAPEYRLPWVLRALAVNAVSSPEYAKENMWAVSPPLLGTDLISHVRARFDKNEEIRRQFQNIAKAIITDNNDSERSVSLILELMAGFVVRRKTLRRTVDSYELRVMVDHGWIKEAINDSNEAIIVPRLPELVASEMARYLSQRLVEKLQSDNKKAVDWLIKQTSKLPLGDVIGAQAILDAWISLGSLPLDLFNHLLDDQPRIEKIHSGTRAVMYLPEVGKVELTFRENGELLLRKGGIQSVIEIEDNDEFQNSVYAGIESWLILSHLAGHKLMAASDDSGDVGRVDPIILSEVGASKFVLRRPCNIPEMDIITMHEHADHGSIVCHRNGMVEPITVSIFKFLEENRELATEWIEEAVASNSYPLLARINIALQQLASEPESEEKNWARIMLDKHTRPTPK